MRILLTAYGVCQLHGGSQLEQNSAGLPSGLGQIRVKFCRCLLRSWLVVQMTGDRLRTLFSTFLYIIVMMAMDLLSDFSE